MDSYRSSTEHTAVCSKNKRTFSDKGDCRFIIHPSTIIEVLYESQFTKLCAEVLYWKFCRKRRSTTEFYVDGLDYSGADPIQQSTATVRFLYRWLSVQSEACTLEKSEKARIFSGAFVLRIVSTDELLIEKCRR